MSSAVPAPGTAMGRVSVILSAAWARSGGAWARGAAFVDGALHRGEALARRLDTCADAGALEALLRRARGCFAAVIVKQGWCAVAADAGRTIPLFYGVHGGELVVSHDAYAVDAACGGGELDPAASLEYLLAGLVTGQRTLSPRVRQTRTGELVVLTRGGGGEIAAAARRYYEYTHLDGPGPGAEALQARHDEVLDAVFRRLVEYAAGRTIVVPLSGGYDSRLVVLMLRRLRYDNVLAFTYGVPGSEEVEISRRVAADLGLRWAHVPYSRAAWRAWFASEAMRRYLRLADNLGVNPHIQDWGAVYELSTSGRIAPGSVFAPGLAADLQTGSFSKKYSHLYATNRLPREVVLDALVRYQYRLWPWLAFRKRLGATLAGYVERAVDGVDGRSTPAGVIEAFVGNENCGKWVNNSVRAYEFFGHDYWLPFWDVEFLEFWSRVPLAEKVGQRLYKAHIAAIYGEVAGVGRERALARDGERPLKARARYSLRNSLVGEWARVAYHALANRRLFEHDPLQFAGCLPQAVYEAYRRQAISINSFLSIARLGYVDLTGESQRRLPPISEVIAELLDRGAGKGT